MQATKSFEVSLQGALPACDLDAVLQRCSLLCSSSSPGRFHWREVLFDALRNYPNPAIYNANNITARSLDVKLACRRDLDNIGNSETPWRVRIEENVVGRPDPVSIAQEILRLPG